MAAAPAAARPTHQKVVVRVGAARQRQQRERLAALATANASGLVAPANSLTPRERQIASLVSKGLSNKEIALGLRIGPATVKNHVHNILDKLGVRRRAAIAACVSEAR